MEYEMHETTARLYEAVEKIRGGEAKPTTLARILNVSPQTMSNWESRGLSLDGMIDAQKHIGCSAVWLRSGEGPMVFSEPVSRPSELSDAMKRNCETARELEMLIIHRLSNEDGRLLIDDAVESARRELKWSGLVNQS